MLETQILAPLSLFKWRFSLLNHSGASEDFIQSFLVYNLPYLCQDMVEGQAEKWEKYVLIACQKHYLMWPCYSFKANTFFITTSFLGVAKSIYAFLFTLNCEWKEKILWTTYHFSSASQSNSVKHARESPNTELPFSTGFCSVLDLGRLLIPSLTARSSSNFALFVFHFQGYTSMQCHMYFMDIRNYRIILQLMYMQ